ncbi:hypothetical protein [Streptomyces sp. NPDC018045]|uniref:hypothetical protein n=1 Tax=Streptomyces sp. NPDC018045 TaxID=3365037 RepID=UPI003793AE45
MTTVMPTPPVVACPAEQQDPSQAVIAALVAAGATVEPRVPETPALEVMAYLKYTALPFAGVDLVPLRPEQAGEILRQALMRHGVHAHIIVSDEQDGARRTAIRPVSVEDAFRLADVIVKHLPPVYAAAHRLRSALGAAGLEQPCVSANGARVLRGGQWTELPASRVVLGRVRTEAAWRLLAALDPYFEPVSEGDTQVGRLPAMFLQVADFATGVRLKVTIVQCERCGRTAGLDLGDLEPGEAVRLAEVVEAARVSGSATTETAEG